VRAKYRIGESLRVVYRTSIGGTAQVLTARAFTGGDSAAAYAKALRTARPVRELPGVVHDAELDTVWWTFPNDRRLHDLEALLSPAGAASEVAEYAPERSLTVRTVAPSGETVAYVKAYAPGVADVDALAARYDHVAARLLRSTGGGVRSPRAISSSAARGILVLEPMPGRRWADLATLPAAAALQRLGGAIAAVHDVEPAAATPMFGRLAPARIATSAALVGRARPDVATRVAAVTERLLDELPASAPAVLLHGDCHPKNALLTDDGVCLIDLDQSGLGDPAADLGSLLARLRHGEAVGELTSAEAEALIDAALAGYAAVRPLPSTASLRWHTAAALVAERMMRAVNRVHLPALANLGALADAAEAALAVRSVA
jgi:Ser/Thr protein kinase RdoA (MazF antagonist)